VMASMWRRVLRMNVKPALKEMPAGFLRGDRFCRR
jgi:hypothetical protein